MAIRPGGEQCRRALAACTKDDPVVWLELAAISALLDDACLAWGDLDGDGLPDGCRNYAGVNHLFHNDGPSGAAAGNNLIPGALGAQADLTHALAWGIYRMATSMAVANSGANRLYRNDGGGKFFSLTPSAAWAMTRTLPGDNGDGAIDLLFANYGVSRLYRNAGSAASSWRRVGSGFACRRLGRCG
jgi:hypothetical protein